MSTRRFPSTHTLLQSAFLHEVALQIKLKWSYYAFHDRWWWWFWHSISGPKLEVNTCLHAGWQWNAQVSVWTIRIVVKMFFKLLHCLIGAQMSLFSLKVRGVFCIKRQYNMYLQLQIILSLNQWSPRIKDKPWIKHNMATLFKIFLHHALLPLLSVIFTSSGCTILHFWIYDTVSQWSSAKPVAGVNHTVPVYMTQTKLGPTHKNIASYLYQVTL